MSIWTLSDPNSHYSPWCGHVKTISMQIRLLWIEMLSEGYSRFVFRITSRAVGTDTGLGGGAQIYLWYHTYISKGYYLVHKYICILLYSLSYGPILAILLCIDFYIVVFKLFDYFGWQNIVGGGGTIPLRPPPLFLRPWLVMPWKVIRIKVIRIGIGLDIQVWTRLSCRRGALYSLRNINWTKAVLFLKGKGIELMWKWHHMCNSKLAVRRVMYCSFRVSCSL